MDAYRSKNWKVFPAEVFRLDNHTCTMCGRSAALGGLVLQVHHKRYLPGHKPWEYPYDLCSTMCKGCHAAEHGIVAPRVGWTHCGWDDLGGLDGECELCGNEIRYVFDLAIRRLDFAVPETWNVRPLVSEKVGPVMRPELIPRFEHGDYLALGSKTRPDAWAQWLKTHPSAHRPTEIRYYDSHSLIVEAASAGLGVALSPLVLAVDDVERGSLAAPAGFDPDGSHYGLIWLGSNELQGVEFELAEWLQAQFSHLAPRFDELVR